jgi:hypothetical protein
MQNASNNEAAQPAQEDNAPPPPEIYEPVTGTTYITRDISESNTMIQILWWIGFRTNAQTTLIYNDGVDGWESIRMLSKEDIDTMAKSFAGRTTQNGRIIFGTNRTKRLRAVVNWVQDFGRVNEDPRIRGLNEIKFKAALVTAESREKIRCALKENKIPSDASPGPLIRESKWKEWEEKFENYLRLHLGSSGVPLSYVIREDGAYGKLLSSADFIAKTTALSPHQGEYYEADNLTVFNFIVSFTTGHPSGDWVKDTLKYSSGRRSMKALRDHFLGEGNATRSLASAENLRSSLHYKNERSMAFETFLTQTQRMFNIFDQENEPMSEEAKIRFLFQAIQHKDLLITVEALRAQQTAGSILTYTACANHLTTAVSQLPEYIQRNRNISGVEVGSVSTSSIYKEDGTINATGIIKDWDKLSSSDKRLVYKERKRLGVKYGRGGNDGNRNVAKGNQGAKAANSNTITQLRKQNNNLKRRIKALKSTPTEESVEDSNIDDAGDEFGGKNSKKKKPNNA